MVNITKNVNGDHHVNTEGVIMIENYCNIRKNTPSISF
jgi:hypothetical protein